jgi:two-component system response regulator DevR
VQPDPAVVRVFLVDDHEVVRRGVAEVLEDDAGIAVVGEAGSAAEALARVPAVRQAHVDDDDVRADGDGAQLLLLTSYSDAAGVAAGVRAGAHGYVLKQVRGSALVSAVLTIAAGGTVYQTDVRAGGSSRPVPNRTDRLAQLTEQERSVLRLIGEGLTNRQIGDRMGLAEKTVKNYTSHLLAKLGLERRTQAAILATELRDRPGR